MSEYTLMECQCCGNRTEFKENDEWLICKSCGVWFRYETEEEKRGCADGYRNLKKYKWDEAQEDFEAVIANNPESIDARWGLLLARFGVVYIKGFFDNVTEPIYCFPEYDELEEGGFRKQREYREIMDILDKIASNPKASEKQVKKAIEMRYLYEAKAKKIDRAIKKFCENKQMTENDVFICVKISAATEKNPQLPGETYDSHVAQELYDALSAHGIKTFYSYETLHNNVDSDDLIWVNILQSRKMILIGSSREYLESAWVKSEWKRWNHIGRMEDLYIVSLKHNNEYPKEILPHELRKAQIYTLDTYKEKLLPHICEALKPQEEPETQEQILARYEALFKAKFEADEAARLEKERRDREAAEEAERERQRQEAAAKAEAARLEKERRDREAAEEAERERQRKAEAARQAEAEAGQDGKIVYKDGRTEVLKYGITEIPKRIYSDKENIVSVVLPESIEKIANGAFDHFKNLKSIVIPKSVTAIYKNAFWGCENLVSVEIPENVSEIGEGAFSFCSNLAEIDIPNSVTTIGKQAFYYCRNLERIGIPSSVKTIKGGAFDRCGLKNIYYGGTETDWKNIQIGEGNASLKAAAIHYENEMQPLEAPMKQDGKTSVNKCAVCGSMSFKKIGTNYICKDCGNLFKGDITGIPTQAPAKQDGKIVYKDGHEEVLKYGITEIKEKAYYENEDIVSVVLPNSVTSIGENAFYWCRNLSSITIPDSVTSIGENAFYWCRSLTSIDIPSSVTQIGKDAFSVCSGLTSITIPDSVTTIGGSAFMHCSSLTSIIIPDSVTTIGEGAFWGCSSLTSITIPKSVTQIGKDAFFECSSLTSITIPSSVTSIGNSAFHGCSSLASITIPNSVTTIGGSAFSSCSSLTSIAIPGSVTNIGDFAFGSCSSLTSINIPEGVTAIMEGTFSSCSSLASITIPKSVTAIDCGAFYDCSHLKDIYYGGLAFDWKKIKIDKDGNEKLVGLFGRAKIHYNSK